MILPLNTPLLLMVRVLSLPVKRILPLSIPRLIYRRRHTIAPNLDRGVAAAHRAGIIDRNFSSSEIIGEYSVPVRRRDR